MEHNKDNHSHAHHPLIPLGVYFKTLGALLVLTVLTVGVSYFDFGSLANVIVALTIASVKASLVLMFFMGLKYDNNLNRAYILSSFVALVLLIGVTATDLWVRPQPKPVVVKSASGPLSQEEFDRLMGAGSELLTKGKSVYDVNCAVCHGATGKGDGVGGAALEPKPRDFSTAGASWKNGSSGKSIYVTLLYGIPGGGMASYKALPVTDRIALVHYVQSLSMDKQATAKGEERFADAIKEDGVGSSGAGPAKVALPIDFAIERILKN